MTIPFPPQNFKKTGTTIAGIVYDKGVILAADKRATSGPIVADKQCFKIHPISPNIIACGAGVAADTDRVTKMASRDLRLFRRKYHEDNRVFHAVRLTRNYLWPRQGYICAALIYGGVDINGIHLYNVSPHGYYSSAKFLAMGSGSIGATAILEAEYRDGLIRQEAIDIAVKAVKAGIMNDLYSGTAVDVAIVEMNEQCLANIEIKKSYAVFGRKMDDEKLKRFDRGSITILKEDVYNILETVDEDVVNY